MALVIYLPLCLLLTHAENEGSNEPVTVIATIRSMTPEEAEREHAVEITGVVTLSNASRPEMFVQDETAGIYVQSESLPPEIRQGSRVHVIGRYSRGFFSPYVNATKVEILGMSELPPPLSFSFSLNDSRWLDAQCVQSHGLVREVGEYEGKIRLIVEGIGGVAYLEFREAPTKEQLLQFIGTVVRIRGVCVPEFDAIGNVTGNVRLILQSVDELNVVESAERVSSVPLQSVTELRRFVPAVSPIPFARMEGVVIANPFRTTCLVQDPTGGCTVHLRPDSPQALLPGTRVEVDGFLSWVGQRVIVKSAIVKIRGTVALPRPLEVSSEEMLVESDACRVQLTGRVANSSYDQFTIVGDFGTVSIVMNSDWKLLFEPGSTMRVTGALMTSSDSTTRFNVLPLEPVDIVLVSPPPPAPMNREQVATFAAGFASLLAIGGIWVFTLRRSVRRRTFELSEANALLEVRVADRTEELAAANRELEAFCYSVSHDLRAPLRSIDGFSRAVQEDYQDRLDPQGVDYLQRVQSAAGRMGELIDDLLNLSRVTRADLRAERIDMSAMAADIVRELRLTARERVVDVSISPDLSAIGDKNLVRILLDNLLGNAWKYTSRTQGARIEFGHQEIGGVAVFFIRDNGVGFDCKYATKLFQPFQRLHRTDEFPGHGIGLATVLRIVRRHGGQVGASGNVDQGAVFRFTLAKIDPGLIHELQR